MARRKKVESSEISDAAKRAQELLKLIKDDDKAILTNAKANMVEFISSGSYAFNRMISGSYFKGYASNRLYALHGPSGCGKSLMAGCAAREAQKMGYQVIYYDSENAIDREFCARLGIDYDSVIIRYPETISDFRNKAVSDMTVFRESDPNLKIFMVCDSIGNLLGTKEANDIAEGKSASDMGQRAKELRTCARALTNKCGRFNIPMVVVNHSYEQAAANPMAASVTKMSGGEGFVYACTGIISLKKKTEKEREKDAAGDNKSVVKGVILKASTTKNRVVPEGLDCQIYISFARGIQKYYGLLADALEHDFFEKQKTRILVKHLDKKLFTKKIYTKEIWEPILNDLNEKVESTIRYDMLERDDIIDELDEQETDDEESTNDESSDDES